MRSELAPLEYHCRLRDYLRREHAASWDWFSGAEATEDAEKAVRLELLKTTLRLDRESNAELYAHADRALRALGLDIPVTLYQAHDGGGSAASAGIFFARDHGHVVLFGDLLAKLAPGELTSVIGHELSHHLLWTMEGGDFLAVDRLLAAMANEPGAGDVHLETARLHRLYVEIFCDRGGFLAAAEPDPEPVSESPPESAPEDRDVLADRVAEVSPQYGSPVPPSPRVLITPELSETALADSVSALVKVHTGLSEEVDAEAYLRQADEIFAEDEDVKTEGVTHPEAFIRARALRLWAADAVAGAPDFGDPEVDRMIVGTPDIDCLDLLAAESMSDFTRKLLTAYLAPAWFCTEEIAGHARLFFDDLEPAEPDAEELAEIRSEAAEFSKSTGRYLAYLLLDFVAADRDLEENGFAQALYWAELLDIRDPFEKVARAELKVRKGDLDRIRKSVESIRESAALEHTRAISGKTED